MVAIVPMRPVINKGRNVVMRKYVAENITNGVDSTANKRGMVEWVLALNQLQQKAIEMLTVLSALTITLKRALCGK